MVGKSAEPLTSQSLTDLQRSSFAVHLKASREQEGRPIPMDGAERPWVGQPLLGESCSEIGLVVDERTPCRLIALLRCFHRQHERGNEVPVEGVEGEKGGRFRLLLLVHGPATQRP